MQVNVQIFLYRVILKKKNLFTTREGTEKEKCKNAEIQKYKVEIQKLTVKIEKWKVEKKRIECFKRGI